MFFFAFFLTAVLDKRNRQVLAYVSAGLSLVTFITMWISYGGFPRVITLFETLLTIVGSYCVLCTLDSEMVGQTTQTVVRKPQYYSSSDVIVEIAKLQDLATRGIITQNDLMNKKKELISRVRKVDENVEAITKLKALAEKGIITKEEYLNKRKEILGE